MKRPNAQTPNSASRWSLSLAAILCSAIVLFFGCSKTERDTDPAGTGTVADPATLIRDFLGAVGHHNLVEERDGAAISVDSAVWYIEAALNWTLTAPDRSFNDLQTDTLIVSLPTVGGSVSAASVESAYGPLQATIMGTLRTYSMLC